MNILVANLGSTSLKFRLFRFDGAGGATLLAKGGYERVTDYGKALDDCLAELKAAGHVKSPADVHGVGFKTVLGRNLTGCVPADDRTIAALDGFKEIAPAHNPPYAIGIQRFREKMPGVPLVALFETAFYQWIPEAAARYAVPESWHQAGVRRYGFHGASHKFVAERSAELLGRADIAKRVRERYQAGPTPVSGKLASGGCTLSPSRSSKATSSKASEGLRIKSVKRSCRRRVFGQCTPIGPLLITCTPAPRRRACASALPNANT